MNATFRAWRSALRSAAGIAAADVRMIPASHDSYIAFTDSVREYIAKFRLCASMSGRRDNGLNSMLRPIRRRETVLILGPRRRTAKSSLMLISLGLAILTVAIEARAADPLPLLPRDYGEQVVMIPSYRLASVLLETTIYKPAGPGPFPVLIFNHGKDSGPDMHQQKRMRPLAEVREFLLRGYMVVAPNRRGFAGSGGDYVLRVCGVTDDGFRQSEDVRATIAYLRKLPYADTSRVVVSGASQGGLVSIAYGASPATGVRALINFNGGTRQINCPGWEDNLVRAYATYGHRVKLPSLWLYGDNDALWSSELIQRMFDAYRGAGAPADFANMGSFKEDSHKLVADPDGTKFWWPPTERFLARLGLPTQLVYRPPEAVFPPSDFAPIDAVKAVPYLNTKGQSDYRDFLTHGNPRVFVTSEQGSWSFAVSGDDPLDRAMTSCRKGGGVTCRPYVIDDDVVWTTRAPSGQADSLRSGPSPSTSSTTAAMPISPTPPPSGYAEIENVGAVPYLSDHGRDVYRQFLAHPVPRAFVIAPNGSMTVTYGGSDPLAAALKSCQARTPPPCEAYAVNNVVVWEKK